MESEELRGLVESFNPCDEHERNAKDETIRFLGATKGIPWSRKNFDDGHVCASAWIISHDRTKALLFNHKKLGKWVQIGGHIEEQDADFFAAVLREVEEETGLTDSDFEFKREIFDIDVHVYPPRGDEPKHRHYDLRVLVRTKPDAATSLTDAGGLGLSWIPYEKIREMNTDESVMHSARRAANAV